MRRTWRHLQEGMWAEEEKEEDGGGGGEREREPNRCFSGLDEELVQFVESPASRQLARVGQAVDISLAF
jgi:hypothetical protein